MKYLLRSEEIFETKSSTRGNTIPKINRAELLAQLEAAEFNGDWDQVAQLIDLLRLTNESSLLDWHGHSLLLESVQAAKAIVQEVAAAEFNQEKKKLNGQLDQEKESAEPLDEPTDSEEPGESREEGQDRRAGMIARLRKKIEAKYFGPKSDFEEIKKLVNFSPQSVLTFTRFRYEQGASMENLVALQRLLVELKDYVKQLPMTPDEYSKLAYSPETIEPGYEMLGDELNKLLELQGGNWLISKLPKDAMRKQREAGLWSGPIVNLREEFKNAPQEMKLKIQKQAAALNKLNKPALLRLVLSGLPAKPSLDAVLDTLNNQVKNAETDRGKLIEIAAAAYPSVVILYAEGDHLVFSFRNDSQLPFLCAKATGWCIQPAWYNKGYADRFWSYASGSLQLGILDFSVDSSNPYHTVGITIEPNKSVKSLCNQPNHCTSGSDYRALLSRFECGGDGAHSYPKELIDAIEMNFETEVSTKTKLDPIYQKIKKFSEGEREYSQVVTKTLMGLLGDKKLTELADDDVAMNSEKNQVSQLIALELKALRNSPETKKMRDEFLNKRVAMPPTAPIKTPAEVKIFEILFEGEPELNEKTIDRLLRPATAVLDGISKKGLEEFMNTNPSFSRIYKSLTATILALNALKEKIKQ